MKRGKIHKFINICLNTKMFYPIEGTIDPSTQDKIDEGLFQRKGVAYTLATMVNKNPFYRSKQEADKDGVKVGDLKAYVRVLHNPDTNEVQIGVNAINTPEEVFYSKQEFIDKYGEW